jgi:addiction module HigA family antidote
MKLKCVDTHNALRYNAFENEQVASDPSGRNSPRRIYETTRPFQNALARALNVPPRRINEIVLEKRAITADTALRLARYFGTSAEMWAGLQADYDLRLVRYEKARTIEREVEPLALDSLRSNPT